MEFIRYDLASGEGWCEFQRQQQSGAIVSTHIPSMMYINANGDLVEVSDNLQNQAALQEKLERLLAGG